MNDPLLECRALTRRFGGFAAVNDVSLTLEKGRINALIGPNGAGKSTLFNLITGALPVSAGQVIFDGRDITALHAAETCHLGISRTFQLTRVFQGLDLRENLHVALMLRSGVPALGGRAARRRLDEMALEALETVGLGDQANWLAGELSHGDQRLLEIAMVIAQRPRLLLLDEPTQGLSVKETRQMVEHLRDLLRGENLTVLLVEHDMEVVFAIADHLFVLHKGEIIADGPPEDVRDMEAVKDAYLGRETEA